MHAMISSQMNWFGELPVIQLLIDVRNIDAFADRFSNIWIISIPPQLFPNFAGAVYDKQ